MFARVERLAIVEPRVAENARHLEPSNLAIGTITATPEGAGGVLLSRLLRLPLRTPKSAILRGPLRSRLPAHRFGAILFRRMLLILGIVLGASALLLPLSRERRRTHHAETEQRRLAQERQLVVDFMHHMAEALAEASTPVQLAQRIVHAAILCSGALSACLFERGGDGQMRSVAVEGLFPPHRPLDSATRAKFSTRARFIEQLLRSETFPENEGIVGEVIRTGEPQLVADASSDPRIVRHEDAALKVRSVIAVPLRFRERFFGVLAVANSADGQPFTASDLTLLKSLGEQAALALHNAENLSLQIDRKQLDLDLSLASEIQRMLLPHEQPAYPGLDIDARYQAAQKVSGDFYDFIPLEGSLLGVVVADVSGKGIAASLLMAICRSNLRQIAPRHTSPAAALAELNRTLMPDMHPGTFITLLYAVVDANASRVTFARAGHELPLFCRRESLSGRPVTSFVGAEGMPLGLVPDDVFSSVTVDRVEPFADGDALVLYTDGLTEMPNETAQEYSGARLAESAQILFGRSARELNDGILERVRRFAGDVPARDDVTLVAVRRV